MGYMTALGGSSSPSRLRRLAENVCVVSWQLVSTPTCHQVGWTRRPRLILDNHYPPKEMSFYHPILPFNLHGKTLVVVSVIPLSFCLRMMA